VNESNPFLEKKEACHFCHRFYTHAYMSRHVLYHCRDSPHYLPPAPAPPLLTNLCRTADRAPAGQLCSDFNTTRWVCYAPNFLNYEGSSFADVRRHFH
jgi:hypothetical protein